MFEWTLSSCAAEDTSTHPDYNRIYKIGCDDGYYSDILRFDSLEHCQPTVRRLNCLLERDLALTEPSTIECEKTSNGQFLIKWGPGWYTDGYAENDANRENFRTWWIGHGEDGSDVSEQSHWAYFYCQNNGHSPGGQDGPWYQNKKLNEFLGAT